MNRGSVKNRGSRNKNNPSFFQAKQQAGVAYKIKCYYNANEKLLLKKER